MAHILKSALGEYKPSGNPADADVLIGLYFGTVIGQGSVNGGLSDFILDNASGRPIVADRLLVEASPRGKLDVALAVDGVLTTKYGQGQGTWGTLLAAQGFMEENGLSRPMLVAQAN